MASSSSTNEGDYHGYVDNVWSRREWEREQEEEAAHCYQRRLAGCDMGHAGDGGLRGTQQVYSSR